MALRNGTYIREPDGAYQLYFSPYSFNDAAANFAKRDLYDDGWGLAHPHECEELHDKCPLSPGEYVQIRGQEVV